jgi:hypothetical protein
LPHESTPLFRDSKELRISYRIKFNSAKLNLTIAKSLSTEGKEEEEKEKEEEGDEELDLASNRQQHNEIHHQKKFYLSLSVKLNIFQKTYQHFGRVQRVGIKVSVNIQILKIYVNMLSRGVFMK